jgi:hypothetical protein
VEQFSKDLWSALRDEMRSQLGESITDEDFEEQFPPWEKLSRQARKEKMLLTRDETLRLIDRAGYEVRKKST